MPTSLVSPAALKLVALMAAGVIVAGFVLNFGYTNNVPGLSDAAKGFK